ncbi:SMI1/KNR4 family protein [Pseudovibrio ascidiaceicola]|uniref:SMI1/KNR4 family protein n=1 Tax=Pseudovibrio ascidiaceicola TaxID=285279 RepID=UPI003D364B5A
MDVLIHKKENEWQAVAQIEGLISKWEAETQITLPEDYKAFMVKYNGGRVYPCLFKHNVPQELWQMDDDIEVLLDSIFRWQYALERRGDRLEFNEIPEKSLIIGTDPGGTELGLSMEENSFGKVYLIYFAVGPEDDEPVMRTSLLANSFREFVFDKLYENADRDGYELWYTPNTKKYARKVEF